MTSWMLWGPFLVAFGSTVAAIPLLILWANRLGIVDAPSARKVHAHPIPRIGGLGILLGLQLGFVATLALSYALGQGFSFVFPKQFLALVAATLFVAIVGFIDDVRSVSSRFKMVALLFTGALLCGGGASFGGVYLGGRDVAELIWLDWIASVLWISAVAVSVNFIDGLDGLAAGLVALAAGVLAFFLAASDAYYLAALSLSLLGALIGFLLYNRFPAKVFMGDCGSMLIGVCIAGLMLISNAEIGTMRGVVLPSLALAVPLIDCTLTFFRRRYLQRRSIFSAERGHIHHRLLDRGLRHPHAVWALYAVSIASVLIGLVSLAFEGLATFAGLSLLVPLLWGTFRMAGSVRTAEMVRALRSKRDMDRDSKQQRQTFEALQLQFEKVENFAAWWQAVCEACEQFDIVRLNLTVGQNDSKRKLRWYNPAELLFECKTLHVVVPIDDLPEYGGSAQAEIDVAVTRCMELASGRLALLARLLTEFSLTHVRTRERTASSKPRADRSISRSMPVAQDAGPFAGVKVAIVHDFLYTYCGAERVLEQLINVFPQCDVLALFDFLPPDQREFLKGKSVRTSFVQRLPFARKNHRNYLPLVPLAIEQLDVSQYDLVISSSYLAAKGVITGPDQLHVSYCHSPVRYAWDLQHQYLDDSNLGFGPKGIFVRAILHYLRNWDVRSSLGVDHFIANSQFVARRIRKVYRRRAKVIHPPVDTAAFALSEKPREDFYLVAGRMVPYKKTEMIVSAFRSMPDRKLVVIGEGPEMSKVREVAGDNVTLLGFQDAEVLIDTMQRAKALIFAAEEDFGIVPVEALACGTPVIAYGRGGVTESVIEGEHGVFFEEQTPESLVEAIGRFEAQLEFGKFQPAVLRQRSQAFSIDEFRAQIIAAVSDWKSQRWKNSEQPETADSPTSAERTNPNHSAPTSNNFTLPVGSIGESRGQRAESV